MPLTAERRRDYFLAMTLSVLTTCVFGVHANPKIATSTACQNVTGVNYPAACPRSNDPDSFTRCCETNGKPSCCPPLQRGIHFKSTCGPDFQAHGIPYCPMPNEPAENNTCCSLTTFPLGIKTTVYYCCHTDDGGLETIAIIIVSVVVVVSVLAILGCAFCAYRFIRARKNAAQTGYAVVE
ncbi:uncharacterized protein LOC135498850 [Lineus longissimus]|uniref:uncharacterized protein LOC135498850 n=1 Tax=Lineus longissimus TaxID=88925 RepID=UPI002B4CA7A3